MSTQASAIPLHRGEVQCGVSVAGFAAGFFFAARGITVLVTARWLNVGTEAGVALSFLLSVMILMTAAVQAFGPCTYSISPSLRARPMKWALAYLLFAGTSLTWTRAASPASSALYWGALACDVLTVHLVCRGSSVQVGTTRILRGFITGSCVLAAIAWMMPTAADLRLGDLEYFNTNQIANLCALSLLLLPLAWRIGSVHTWIASFFLALTLLRSLSKATLVAFVIAQGYRMFRDSAISRSRKVALVAGALALTLMFSGLIEVYFTTYASAGNQAETLTGRTAIWAWTFDAALEHPLIGNGFDSMWKIAPPFGGELFEARHAENELLQQFFAYGAAGVVLLIGLYGSAARMARHSRDTALRYALTALVIFAIVRGVAEAEPFDLLMPLWLIATLAAMATAGDDGSALRPQLSFVESQLRGGIDL